MLLCRPFGKKGLGTPSCIMYVCTAMQMEKMNFSAHRQPEFCQVLRVSSLLKYLIPKKINQSLENYNSPLSWVTSKVQEFGIMNQSPSFAHPARLWPSNSLLFPLFSKEQTWGPKNQNQWGTTDLSLCPDSIISLISNNSQGRRFPGLPRWSCNSFMMVTGCFHNIQPKSSWQINKSVN